MKPFPKVLLSQPSAMCAKVRDAGQKVFGELTAQEEAQYEPFRKVLSGDKLDLYNRRLKSYKLYGLGGKVLKTPEEYRDSNLWCTTGVADRDGIVPVWSVDYWHFKGMTKVGTVETKTGSGRPGAVVSVSLIRYEPRHYVRRCLHFGLRDLAGCFRTRD